ncbi:MAG: anti-sigma factor [Xanthomonadaceae bacterium]|nr:anti-sigma factor [Xanthomonadaceae bacterium]
MNEHDTTSWHPDDTVIHAYVDGRLNDATGACMEAWLGQHPDRAAEIRGWRRDAQQLRAAFGDLPTQAAVPPTLDPATLRMRRQRRLHTRMALAAGLVLALGAGGIGGWQAHTLFTPAAAAPMADALQAYRMFATGRHANLDVVQRHAGELQAWLDERFQRAAPLPDLDASGFMPVGGRLIATDSGPAAMVLYENRNGDAISFYIRSPSSRAGMLARGQRREGQLAAAYWSGNGYNYALVSRADTTDLRVIRDASLSAPRKTPG